MEQQVTNYTLLDSKKMYSSDGPQNSHHSLVRWKLDIQGCLHFKANRTGFRILVDQSPQTSATIAVTISHPGNKLTDQTNQGLKKFEYKIRVEC